MDKFILFASVPKWAATISVSRIRSQRGSFIVLQRRFQRLWHNNGAEMVTGRAHVCCLFAERNWIWSLLCSISQAFRESWNHPGTFRMRCRGCWAEENTIVIQLIPNSTLIPSWKWPTATDRQRLRAMTDLPESTMVLYQGPQSSFETPITPVFICHLGHLEKGKKKI